MPRGKYDRSAARPRRDHSLSGELADTASPSVVLEADAEQEKENTPRAVRLLRDHGYVEQAHNKGVFHWSAGEVVTNPATIAHLMERGAELEPAECLDPPAIPPNH